MYARLKYERREIFWIFANQNEWKPEQKKNKIYTYRERRKKNSDKRQQHRK